MNVASASVNMVIVIVGISDIARSEIIIKANSMFFMEDCDNKNC